MMWRRGDHGWLEVICGPMFSGKSEELIRRVTRAAIARIPVQVFKPALDNRYADEKVVSHSSLSVAAKPVDSARELLMAVHDHTEVIGVDEGQFFDDELVEIVERLAASAKQVIVAGLDLDYLRSEEHTSELQSRENLVCRLLLEKKNRLIYNRM